jgi:uncharacterized protein YaaQ
MSCRAIRLHAAGDSSLTGHRAPPRRTRGSEFRRPRPAPAGGGAAIPFQAPDAQKLLVMIVADADADPLVRALVQRSHAATKIGSSGGFLRRGNTTLLCGVPAADVDEVLLLIKRLCPARSELLTLGALPLAGEIPFVTEPVEVRVGGAVVFILNVERFERV